MSEDLSDILFPFNAGVRLSVRAKPGLSRARAPRIVDLAEGHRALEITVAARAEDGKANKAILEFLAKELGLKKRDLTIKTGTTNRLKLIQIHGDPNVLGSKITKWLETK